MTSNAFLQIQDIVKDFNGFKAVNHVSLDIAKGEIFALLGDRQGHAYRGQNECVD